MKPAVCGVCGVSAIESCNGDWLAFADYQSPSTDEIGHPEGLEWFCETHLPTASLLTNQKASGALAALHKRFLLRKGIADL